MKVFAFLIVLFSMIRITGFGQQSYFVAVSGNDNNPGTIISPWASIQFGLNRIISGDTLFVRAGSYYEKINFPVSGAENHRITLAAYREENVVLDGSLHTADEPMVAIISRNYITVKGLEIQNNIGHDAQGILVRGTCTGIEIINNSIHDIHFSADENDMVSSNTNAQALIIYGTDPLYPIADLRIEGNEIYHCRLGESEALAVNGNVEGFLLQNNYVHDVTNIGIDVIGHEGVSPNPVSDQARNGVIRNNIVHHCIAAYATSGGIYVDGGKNIIIENNTMYQNGFGIEIGCENKDKSAEKIQVRNNIIYQNLVAGIALGGYDYPDETGKVKDCLFSNNTLYENDVVMDGNGELLLSYSENCRFVNNVFYTNAQNVLCYGESTIQGLAMNYNAYFCPGGADQLEFYWFGSSFYGFESFKRETDMENKGVFADPLFVNATSSFPDFHITSNSPVLDKGDPVFIPANEEVDMDGQNRVGNFRVDCGADEYYLSLIVCTLSVFEANLDGEKVIVKWTGTCFSNQGGSYFVQRSTDLKVWENIGEVKVQLEKINTAVNYEAVDLTPLEGTSFYRTQFVDANGWFLNSNYVVIQYSKNTILLYPNPAIKTIRIIDDKLSLHQLLSYKIYDMSGEKMLELIDSGTELDISALPRGSYIIKVYTTENRLILTEQFMVQ